MATQPNITYVGSHPNNRFIGRKGFSPQLLVSHVMQGTMAGTRSAFNNPNHLASAHYGISHDGHIEQYVSDANAAYANGPLRKYNKGVVPLIDWCVAKGVNPNYLTIAVEWEGRHSGIWMPAGGGLQTLNVSEWWVPTPVQLQAGIDLYGWLCQQHNIPVDRQHLCRHSDFDGVTKSWCPGQGFPLARIITALGGTV